MNIVTKLLRYIRTPNGHGSQKNNLVDVTFHYDDKQITKQCTKLQTDFLCGKIITIEGNRYLITEVKMGYININDDIKYTAKCIKWK